MRSARVADIESSVEPKAYALGESQSPIALFGRADASSRASAGQQRRVGLRLAQERGGRSERVEAQAGLTLGQERAGHAGRANADRIESIEIPISRSRLESELATRPTQRLREEQKVQIG